MPLTKLTTTDAFVLTDIPDVPATGVVRMGKKILQSSAADLARSATYAFAAFGVMRSGASAGINAEGDACAPAREAFIAEVTERSWPLHLDPGKGMAPGSLAGLDAAGERHPAAGSPSCTVAGVVAAASWACGGDVAGRTAAIEGVGSSPTADLVAEALRTAGASIVDPEGVDAKPWLVWGADVDVLLCGTKPGTLNHQGAPMVKAPAIVPWGPIPVTTKAYVMLNRLGKRVLPDFVSASCGLVAEYLPNASSMTAAELETAAAQLAVYVLTESALHSDGVMMGAFERAEGFLATWSEFEPFGRPLAA